jgi:hypothetical protein
VLDIRLLKVTEKHGARKKIFLDGWMKDKFKKTPPNNKIKEKQMKFQIIFGSLSQKKKFYK